MEVILLLECLHIASKNNRDQYNGRYLPNENLIFFFHPWDADLVLFMVCDRITELWNGFSLKSHAYVMTFGVSLNYRKRGIGTFLIDVCYLNLESS
jgi:GNAT superfamily N-acetyltransferase